ncbi:calcineurin-like metallo-phosphoesterase superfamily protein, partial [Trifolium pratense]
RYIVLFVLTLLALLLWPTSSTSFWHQCWNLAAHFKQLITSMVSRSETKEKDEDANYEYEMMWDAEGSMHLIKKPLKTSTVNSNERSLGERGNAVMRPTVRKNTGQEADFSVNMDMASSTGLDPLAKLPPRTGKSKTTIIIQRLLRTLRMLTVIAAVNVPLYMMLLFKDWIDK